MNIKKFLNPMNYVRKLVKVLITEPLVKLDFINYRYPHFHGPKDRIFIKNPKNVFLANAVFNTRGGNIYIGEGVIFSYNCMVLTGRHRYEAKDVNEIWEVSDEEVDIEIGDGTWIACNVIISGNVKIGKHCVIAAGSVVTLDIPDNCMAAGVPAKVIREI